LADPNNSINRVSGWDWIVASLTISVFILIASNLFGIEDTTGMEITLGDAKSEWCAD
jgi:hypothetical protein